MGIYEVWNDCNAGGRTHIDHCWVWSSDEYCVKLHGIATSAAGEQGWLVLAAGIKRFLAELGLCYGDVLAEC